MEGRSEPSIPGVHMCKRSAIWGSLPPAGIGCDTAQLHDTSIAPHPLATPPHPSTTDIPIAHPPPHPCSLVETFFHLPGTMASEQTYIMIKPYVIRHCCNVGDALSLLPAVCVPQSAYHHLAMRPLRRSSVSTENDSFNLARD